jgi:VanZ family protein
LGRSADITDVIMNTVGAAIGLGVAHAVIGVARRRGSTPA